MYHHPKKERSVFQLWFFRGEFWNFELVCIRRSSFFPIMVKWTKFPTIFLNKNTTCFPHFQQSQFLAVSLAPTSYLHASFCFDQDKAGPGFLPTRTGRMVKGILQEVEEWSSENVGDLLKVGPEKILNYKWSYGTLVSGRKEVGPWGEISHASYGAASKLTKLIEAPSNCITFVRFLKVKLFWGHIVLHGFVVSDTIFNFHHAEVSACPETVKNWTFKLQSHGSQTASANPTTTPTCTKRWKKYSFPRLPNTSWQGVLGVVRGSK